MDEPANLGRSGPLSPDPRLLFLLAAIAPLWAAGKTANPAGRALPIVGPRQRAPCLVAARLGGTWRLSCWQETSSRSAARFKIHRESFGTGLRSDPWPIWWPLPGRTLGPRSGWNGTEITRRSLPIPRRCPSAILTLHMYVTLAASPSRSPSGVSGLISRTQ